jgi:CIC family chloride channel protein
MRQFWARLWTRSESKHLTFLSVVVGAAAGVAAFLFIKLLAVVQLWLSELAHWRLSGLNRAILLTAPGIGGLAAGWLVHRYAQAHRGTGTARVIFALRRRNGFIPVDVTLAKTLASALTIGAGGSAGPEGPAVQIGAGLGSVIGRWRRLPSEYLKTLVAAGASAGIAAVFNAPLAGVMYALEVLLRQTASQAFAVVVLSTVTASVVSYFLVGHRIFLPAPAFFIGRPVEWVAYLALGILTAFAARLFTVGFLSVQKSFNRLTRISLPIRAMLGGLAVGVLGYFHPEVMGAGHEIVSQLLRADPTIPLSAAFLMIILFEKMLSTAFSLASGGSGGLFVPTLSMGALLGTGVGQVVHWMVPQAAPPWAYALLGMGGMFAGFTYAPITSVMLLFEMTNDYPIILPAMFVIGITTLVSRALDPDSLDGHELKEKGLRLHEDAVLSALENVTAREVMSSPVATISETASLREIAQWMAKTRHSGVPVRDSEGHVVGLITYNELHHAYDETNLSADSLTAKGIMRHHVPTIEPGASLTEAVRRMENDNVDRILVISLEEPGKPVGIITKSDVLKIYRSALKGVREG